MGNGTGRARRWGRTMVLISLLGTVIAGLSWALFDFVTAIVVYVAMVVCLGGALIMAGIMRGRPDLRFRPAAPTGSPRAGSRDIDT